MCFQVPKMNNSMNDMHNERRDTADYPHYIDTRRDSCSGGSFATTASTAASTKTNHTLITTDVEGTRFLPPNFEPTIYEVILGRGKQVSAHPGNQRFKELVLSHIEDYQAAKTKTMKSTVLSRIVSSIRATSAITGAGFIKKDSHAGRWCIAEDAAARIATAQVFRDHLHENYKSSKQFKQHRRQDRIRLAQKQKAVEQAKEREMVQKGMPKPQLAGMKMQLSQPPSALSGLQHHHREQQADTGVSRESFMDRLNLVLGDAETSSFTSSLKRKTMPEQDLSSLPSMQQLYGQFEFPSLSSTGQQQQQLEEDELEELDGMDAIATFEDHFADRVDFRSNPFEPRPISEIALVYPTEDGVQLRDPPIIS